MLRKLVLWGNAQKHRINTGQYHVFSARIENLVDSTLKLLPQLPMTHRYALTSF